MNPASSHASSRFSKTLSSGKSESRSVAIPSSAKEIATRVAVGMLWLVSSVALVALLTVAANGQQNYKQLPVAESYQLLEEEGVESAATRRRNKDIYGAIKAGNKKSSDAIESGNPELAATFFKEYIMPSMTRTNSKSLSTLGLRREEFIDDFLSSKTTGAARKSFISSTIIPAMRSLAGADDCHPAARLNAVYLLGLLDSQPGGRDTAPTPAGDAFSSLVQIFTGDQFPDSLKVAAAAGIDRHLQLARAGSSSSLDGADISKAAAQALAIIGDSAAGQEEWDQDLSYWLKKRSAKILGLIGQPGNDGEVVKAMAGLLQIEKPGQTWLAYEAMTALGKIDLTSTDADLVTQSTVAITQFLSQALEFQAITAKSNLDLLIFQNILLEDVDLTIKGNDYSEQPLTTNKGATNRRAASSGSSTRDMGRGGMDMDMDMDMDMEMGMDMDMGGRGGGGGGGNARRRPGAPQVELPVYQLNRIRGMIKALAYGGKQTLSGGSKSIQTIGSDQVKTMITDVVTELNEVIADSDVGIVDLANPPDEDEELEEDPPSNTETMIDLCSRASSRLAAIVRTNGPAQAGETAAASADQPDF